eukprot:3733127-Pyramimonas_sp.AAC.1
MSDTGSGRLDPSRASPSRLRSDSTPTSRRSDSARCLRGAVLHPGAADVLRLRIYGDASRC